MWKNAELVRSVTPSHACQTITGQFRFRKIAQVISVFDFSGQESHPRTSQPHIQSFTLCYGLFQAQKVHVIIVTNYSNQANAWKRKVHSTHSNTMVQTAITVTSQPKLKLCTMLHSFVQTNKPSLHFSLLCDLPMNKYFRNLFFTINVHHSHHQRYHYKHSHIGNQHCTYFTL